MKNLYKAMTIAKPDLVLVQLGPEHLLKNFVQHPEKSVDSKWEFNHSLYLQQLTRDGHELFPSIKSKLNMLKLLKSQGIVVAPTFKDQPDTNETVINYQNYLTKPEPQIRVSKKALTTVATWCDSHNKPVMLADLPRDQLLYNTV